MTLKKRLIAAIVVKDGVAVQSIGFRRFLPVGRPEIAAEFLNRWGIDEILLQDISASRQGRGPDRELLAAVAERCFVPLTVAGGIASVEDAHRVTQSGGDKVAVNTAAAENPALIRAIADRFGNQCAVASIDAVRGGDGQYETVTRGGRESTGLRPEEAARIFADHGAGEILITAVDRDGTKRGFDEKLVAAVAGAVNIPVIASGGAGCPAHFLDVLKIPGVSAAAAANYFNFTEHSVLTTKAFLCATGAALRNDTYANYAGRTFDTSGRTAKRSERDLDELMFEYQPEEVI